MGTQITCDEADDDRDWRLVKDTGTASKGLTVEGFGFRSVVQGLTTGLRFLVVLEVQGMPATCGVLPIAACRHW